MLFRSEVTRPRSFPFSRILPCYIRKNISKKSEQKARDLPRGRHAVNVATIDARKACATAMPCLTYTRYTCGNGEAFVGLAQCVCYKNFAVFTVKISVNGFVCGILFINNYARLSSSRSAVIKSSSSKVKPSHTLPPEHMGFSSSGSCDHSYSPSSG